MTRLLPIARNYLAAGLLTAALVLPSPLPAADNEVIPHGQSQPPGPALSPAEALARMRVPEGFQVELVASEPDLVNPVAMAFDAQGRVYVAESLEYPRSEAGPGRDRIKVLEDTDGDGAADKFTIFADGLNIPSGIAIGHGGVWVANAPDILLLRDTDQDGRADEREVVVTGFGRHDTHELPNSLSWGPDGYLYGLNGVFNPGRVEQDGRVYEFTCAMFRIDPRTRRFELFAEGTSNPWGIAWDPEGSALISACVIDHLWHITETGYYHRQAGAYPPYTWKIGSIVEHTHQKAAYCGLHYFDSDAYPERYRDRLYMGNIHGNCLNVDVLARRGSTYFATADDDFLSANDAWFMPVAVKTGPDGCLYVLDWYDRYHCYQDARRDAPGIDRLRGRLYRIRYQQSPRAEPFDMQTETDEQLVERLQSPNIYFRETATQILAERGSARSLLETCSMDPQLPRKTRLHAMMALVGQGPLPKNYHLALFEHADPTFRAWAVRAAGNARTMDADIVARLRQLVDDTAPDVQLQLAIAARKVPDLEPIEVYAQLLSRCGDDPLIPHIVWQNLHPLLPTQGPHFLAAVKQFDLSRAPALKQIMPRVTERLLGGN